MRVSPKVKPVTVEKKGEIVSIPNSHVRYRYPAQHTLAGLVVAESFLKAHQRGDGGEMNWLAESLDYLDIEYYIIESAKQGE